MLYGISSLKNVNRWFMVHGEKLAVVLCSVNLCRHALPASTGRAAVVYTDQLLCLCWLEERAYKDSHYTAPPPTFHCVVS